MNHPFSRLSLFGLLSCLCYGYLSQFTANEASLSQMAVALGFAVILQALAWYCCWRDNTYPSFAEVLLWAASFRLLGLIGSPILEDDFYRYLWDGYALVEHGTVYTLAPQQWFDAANIPPQFEDILDNINNPHIATIYGPVCQIIFGLSYMIAPGEVWPLQLIFSLFDLGIVILLYSLTNTRNVLLYAWCPLVVKEVAFTAHIDSMAVFFLLAACVAMLKNRNVLLGLLASLAIASKVFAVLLLPFLLYRRPLALILFVVGSALLYAPFLTELVSAEHGLKAMASGWMFNAPLYLLLPNHFVWVQVFMGIVFAGIWCYAAWYWFQHGQGLPRGDWVYGAFLLAIPALNPWYLIWLLPFAALTPSITAWTASAAVLFAYVIGLNLHGSQLLAYQQPWWAIGVEFGLILTAFIYECVRRKTSAYVKRSR